MIGASPRPIEDERGPASGRSHPGGDEGVADVVRGYDGRGFMFIIVWDVCVRGVNSGNVMPVTEPLRRARFSRKGNVQLGKVNLEQ